MINKKICEAEILELGSMVFVLFVKLQIFCVHDEEKKYILRICYLHLMEILMGVTNYDCTATDKTDVIFELIQKRCRKSCILPYCRQNCSIYLFLFLSEYFN